ncbi:COP1-interacting protein 7 [Syzygium oleosum]|uniref:COP1-interacting protein 7 n=1 Tax=Syzygium oleosum TaxID=219896 RepID=UPI0011D2A34F|nr:COP1-interacting protein 7 [Syzygium oleosum]
MKPSTRLDSAVFQLTPTRTRCDLVIVANGKSVKIASGLLSPFLAHLKAAQEQVARGGYSIILEPEPDSDATWFTKGTVERFVRFVSTPEILERVYTLESEILQIEEAIAIQSNNDGGLQSVEDHEGKPAESVEGGNPLLEGSEDKAIVIYTPSAQPSKASGSTSQEGNSKVQLLKVLETRKSVLQKEQGMAFARAVAAGFEIDNLETLMSFAECFGASRLMDACTKFIELWKRKHESGQWLEIEAAEALSSQSDFAAMSASGIVLSDVSNKQKEAWTDSRNAPASEFNGHPSTSPSGDGKPPINHQAPHGGHEYFPAQFPNAMFPPWPMHSPPGAPPVYQPYPMQPMPYYQNYPANGPFFQPAYVPVQDPRSSNGRKPHRRRHSVESGEPYSESEASEEDHSPELVESEKEASALRKKTGRSSKKQSGTVVIRNINYITPKRRNSSNGESYSASDSENEEDNGEIEASQNLTWSSKRKEKDGSSINNLISSDNNEALYGNETDGGHWQAFQSFLLRDNDEEKRAADDGMFSMEKEVRSRRRQTMRNDDPLALGGRYMDQSQRGSLADMQKMSGKSNFSTRASADEAMMSTKVGQGSDGRMSLDGHLDVQYTEVNGRRVAYRRTENDDFMIHGRENINVVRPSDLAEDENTTHNSNAKWPSTVNDDSYIVPLRSIPVSGIEDAERKALDIDSEFPSTSQRTENASKPNYEPDYTSLMPERGTERASIGYDPALDYEMQAQKRENSSQDKNEKEERKRASKKPDKDQKSKLTRDALDKKKNVGPIRKGKPSKLSPLEEAKARAERLRSYKADLQKMKKEKEEEQVKRLEALKLERQKRIAARSSSIPAQPALPSPQTRKQLPTKTSPISHKGSKFSDAEPGSSSPLQRSSVRALSVNSSESQKTSKTTRLSAASSSAGNRLSRSVSSLPAEIKENASVTPETKVSMARIRRLSEPRTSSHSVSSVKQRNTELTRQKVSDGTDSKNLSAIISLDKSKAATLPELKIRTPKSADNCGSKSAPKDAAAQASNKNKSMSSKGAELNNGHDPFSHQSEGDDNPIIEKTVVMLEPEKPASTMLQASQEKVQLLKEDSDSGKLGEKPDIVTNDVALHRPIALADTNGPNQKNSEVREEISSHKVTTCNEEASIKVLSLSTAEKPYQAPYARVSSLEDPCMGNTEYGKAIPTSYEFKTVCPESIKFRISDTDNLKIEKMPETVDKQSKESTKGFRRLLKFGRKGSSSTTSGVNEADNGSVSESDADDHATHSASSIEVSTLKNLISQDETPTAVNTPKKSSRHFSLLSPFRSKNSEKKVTT